MCFELLTLLLEYDYKNTHSVLENEERLCFRVERF